MPYLIPTERVTVMYDSIQVAESMSEVNLSNGQTELPQIILHKDVFQKLLDDIQPIDFRKTIDLETKEKVTQKHQVFAVVRELLELSKKRNWNLCKSLAYIYCYNGAYWKPCSKEEIKKFLSDAALKMGVPEHDAKHYEFADKLLKQFLSEAELPPPEIDPEKILINLLNGTFEFTDSGWKQRKFSPNDFLTYQLPFEYDPDASSPIFDKYLEKVLPDENSRKVIQEFSGYIFTRLNLEKCLVLLGGGANGKSVFMNILTALIGKENVLCYSLGLFGSEYNRAKLSNILLNYSSEKGFDLSPDIFKALISGEPVQARIIYQEPFSLSSSAKFITNCNELPRETENTEAYFRRFIIVPFEVIIPESERDISLAKKIIQDELPGVFNWLLAGLKRILDNQRFTDSDKGEKALAEFKTQSDSVQLFVDENQYEPSEENKTETATLYNEYKAFCKDDGYYPLGKNKFTKRMENKGFQKTRMGGTGAAGFLLTKKSHMDF